MSIISVFPGKGKAKLEAGSASPLTYAKTYTPSGDNEGFSEFKVNAMPSGALSKPSIQQPNANGRVYATAGVSTAGYLPTNETEDGYIDLSTRSGDTITPGTSPKTAVEKGKFTTGDVVVAGDANLAPTNIKSGVSIFGVDGELELGFEIDSFTVSHSDSSVPSEGDNFYNALYIDASQTSLVSKYSGVMPYRIEIRQQIESMEYGAAIMYTEIVALGEASNVSGLTIRKNDEGTAFWEVAPDYLKCYVGNGYIIVYSTSSGNQAKQFNGTYQVIVYYNKTA